MCNINLNVNGLDAEGCEMDKQKLQMYVGRYITNAKGYIKKTFGSVYFLRVIESRGI